MYVYVIKCSIYYKVGFSKNPSNRLRTVKTHNPLPVSLLATLKTSEYLSVEKELHGVFSDKNSNREWFELNEDDLIMLKTDYGFTFKKPINSIFNKKEQDYSFEDIKKVRVDNNKISYFRHYFEDLFCVCINDLRELKKCCLNHDIETIKESMDSLYSQSMEPNKAYNLINKVCENKKESIEYPSRYVAKVVKAIFYKTYGSVLTDHMNSTIERNLLSFLNIDDVIKDLNTKKFYKDEDEFWDYLCLTYLER